jgi:hypothetical protein
MKLTVNFFGTVFPNPAVIGRNQILRLEQEMVEMLKRGDLSPVPEAGVTHYFADGLYARELFIPKGTLLTGKIHRTLHLNIISKGDISVLTEDGMKRIKAPCTIVSKPGMKRVGYAHEDTVWTTIHGTHETDLEVLEHKLIAPSYEELLPAGNPALEGE